MHWPWLVVVVAACGAGDPPPSAPAVPTPPVMPAPVADAATAGAGGPLDLATVVCARAVRCGTIGASQQDECKTTRRLTLVWGSPEMLGIDKLIQENRLLLAPGGVQKCLALLATTACRDGSAEQYCGIGHEPVLPNVAAGGKCEREDECIGGSCTGQTGCSGTCVAKSPLGATCGSNQLCTDGGSCVGGACVAKAAAGAACGGSGPGCVEGLFCDGYRRRTTGREERAPEVLGTCRAPRGGGESCAAEPFDHCRSDLYCAWGDPQPTCQKPLAKGVACRAIDACSEGLACTGIVLKGIGQNHQFAVPTPGRCSPMLDVGDACDPKAFVTGCPQAMRCDQATERCRSGGHAGDPCVSSWITKPPPADEPIVNDGCVSANYCDVATRTCKPALAVGAKCTPQTRGVEDDPCFISQCDPKTKRCTAKCN